jgi:cytochrome c oxidase subunit II
LTALGRASRLRGRRSLALSAAVGILVLTACAGSQTPSTLDAQGPAAGRIEGLWWFMFGISAAVVVFIGSLILLAVSRRRRASGGIDETPGWARRLVIGGGLVFPAVVLSVLWVLTLHDMAALSQPRPAALGIEVIGHQWWWEVRYPQQRIIDANDIHIPVGEPVELSLTTADVNHSFWVPQITAKTDMIAGRANSMTLLATHAGVFRGQCAEYCGLQHANMAFYVIAMPPGQFRAWEQQAAQTPAPPTDPTLQQGEQVFLSSACAACHAIAGTGAKGRVGPDLTHFGSRRTIGAGTIPNTAGGLGGWITDAQAIKPGNIMPPIQLSGRQLQALIKYLESLR